MAPTAMIPYSERLPLACKAFFLILFTGKWPSEATTVAAPDEPAPPPAAAPSPTAPPAPTATQLLAVLQRDGRLIDFLMEDLAAYADAQVGAAARTVHDGCRRAFDQYLSIAPVRGGNEGDLVTVDAGTDPGRGKVIR